MHIIGTANLANKRGDQLPRTLQTETLFSTSLDHSILLGKVDLVHRTDGKRRGDRRFQDLGPERTFSTRQIV